MTGTFRDDDQAPRGIKGRLLGLLSPGKRHALRVLRQEVAAARQSLHLARVGLSSWDKEPGDSVLFEGRRIRINDGPNFYMIYKDVFLEEIYRFESATEAPFILDCGSNIGLTILYFKRLYPRATIIGFDPDPAAFPLLEENVRGLEGVVVHRAALAAREGALTFFSDGKCGSCLATEAPPGGETWTRHEVPCVRLRDYLTRPVDFLKMNIEGAEHSVLADCAEKLRFVREMVIEYHHLPGLPRTLHSILALLDDQGFDYLINDFDGETNPGTRPPFTLGPGTRYFLLIYARRRDP